MFGTNAVIYNKRESFYFSHLTVVSIIGISGTRRAGAVFFLL